MTVSEMLLGILRAPAPGPDDPLALTQLVDAAREAADKIDRADALITQMGIHDTHRINQIADQVHEIVELKEQHTHHYEATSKMLRKSQAFKTAIDRLESEADAHREQVVALDREIDTLDHEAERWQAKYRHASDDYDKLAQRTTETDELRSTKRQPSFSEVAQDFWDMRTVAGRVTGDDENKGTYVAQCATPKPLENAVEVARLTAYNDQLMGICNFVLDKCKKLEGSLITLENKAPFTLDNLCDTCRLQFETQGENNDRT